jgi:hypothetical protein
VGDAGCITIIDRAFAVPGFKHRLSRQAQLFVRILRKVKADMLFDHRLESLGDGFPILSGISVSTL